MSIEDQYVTTALWSSTDDNGEPLDNGDHELSDEAREALSKQAQEFYEKWEELIEKYMAVFERDIEQVGHYFWLSRNHHGAGFFDDSVEKGDIADKLQTIAESYLEVDLYVDDDGLIQIA